MPFHVFENLTEFSDYEVSLTAFSITNETAEAMTDFRTSPIGLNNTLTRAHTHTHSTVATAAATHTKTAATKNTTAAMHTQQLQRQNLSISLLFSSSKCSSHFSASNQCGTVQRHGDVGGGSV